MNKIGPEKQTESSFGVHHHKDAAPGGKGEGSKRIHSRATKRTKQKKKVNQWWSYRVTPAGWSDSGWSTKRPVFKLELVTSHCDTMMHENRVRQTSGARGRASLATCGTSPRGRNEPTGTNTPRDGAMQRPRNQRVKLNVTECKFPALRAGQLAWRQVTALPSLLHFDKATWETVNSSTRAIGTTPRDLHARGRVKWGMGEIIYILYI